MARREVPKEDLVRDATAFATRVELRSSPEDPNWSFVGIRADGGASVYFGDDEFYAFNSRGELRRAFVEGRLLKAENRQLIALRRQRSEGETALAAETMPREEQERLIQRFEAAVDALIRGYHAGELATVRSAGETEKDIVQAIGKLAALRMISIFVAQRPNAD